MKRTPHFLANALLLAVAASLAEANPQFEGWRQAGRYRTTWTAPPERTPSNHSVDGPLMGNGDLLVALGGDPREQCFHLGKNDLWRLESRLGRSSPVPLGVLSLRVPELEGASYEVVQEWAPPKTIGTFALSDGTLRETSLVTAATDLLVIELEAEGRAFVVESLLRVQEGRGSASVLGQQGDLVAGRRSFTEGVDIPSGVSVAYKILGPSVSAMKGESGAVGYRFAVEPGKPVFLVLGVSSRFEDPDYEQRARWTLSGLDLVDVGSLIRQHTGWWIDYWGRSHVELGDEVLEGHYYQSLYTMAAASRNRRFPPGIFGWVTTDTPDWNGDYHLNYNHLAPYYALYSANRIPQADPEDSPILAFRSRGRWYAREVLEARGVLYPVGIGPLGVETTRGAEDDATGRFVKGGMFWGQRSNAAYCLVNIAQRWRCTYDLEYGREVYPFVCDVLDFWESYLRWEDGRYVIRDDSIHEGSGKDVNPILALGLLRNALDLAIDLNRELGGEPRRIETWRHELDHLSGWTTQERDGRTVFRYTEEGTDWWGDNTLGIQHVYPGNALGLDSAPEWLEVARNTIAVMGRWIDFNGSNSFFPAAVRVGYDPEVILERLRAYAENTYPNGFQRDNPHGIENLSTTPNTIDEMLCMSHVPAGTAPGTQVLRLFPVWPRDRDARFTSLRAWGAFLVSSELKGGEVRFVLIESKRGRDCTVVNPWPSAKVKVQREGNLEPEPEVVEGERFTLETAVGEKLMLTRE